MSSFREVVSLLERRDRRLRGVLGAAWAALAASLVAFVLLSASSLLALDLPTWLVAPLLALGVAGTAAAYVLAARAERPRSQLLFEVDVRLGLDARLSSLLAMEERGSPGVFADRVLRDVLRLAPDWRRGVPVPRNVLLLAGVIAAILAFSLAVALLSPQTPGSESAIPAQGSPATNLSSQQDQGGPSETRTGEEPSAPPSAGDGTATPQQHAAAKGQRTLSEILSDLRPALASTSVAAGTASEDAALLESEPSQAELRSELARLQERLEAGGSPPSEDEIQTLRNAAAASPDLVKAIDDAAATSDLDALRQTITQLLSSPASQAAPTTPSTRSELRSADDDSAATAPPAAPPSRSPASGAPSGAPGAGDEAHGSPEIAQNEDPIFASGIGDVAPVTAPLVVGASGGTASYITSGVPVEETSTATDPTPAWALSPTQVQSVLSARELPAGAAEIIRDYFQRITEETP
jgi:hypothetical protein